MPNLNYYQVLGVSKDATRDEIRRAYKRLALQRHPDHGGSSAAFALLQRAHEVLTDPIQRKQYDHELFVASHTPGLQKSPSPTQGPMPQAFRHQKAYTPRMPKPEPEKHVNSGLFLFLLLNIANDHLRQVSMSKERKRANISHYSAQQPAFFAQSLFFELMLQSLVINVIFNNMARHQSPYVDRQEIHIGEERRFHRMGR